MEMDGNSLGKGRKIKKWIIWLSGINKPFVLVLHYLAKVLKTWESQSYWPCTFPLAEVVMKERMVQKETSPFSCYNRIVGPAGLHIVRERHCPKSRGDVRKEKWIYKNVHYKDLYVTCCIRSQTVLRAGTKI